MSGPRDWLETAVRLESAATMTTHSMKDDRGDEGQQHNERSDQDILC